jgi:hypothetical protein
MTHDVVKWLYDGLEKRSKGFKNKNCYGAWELYILSEIFSKEVLTNDYYENDVLKINLYRDKYGLCVAEFKK